MTRPTLRGPGPGCSRNTGPRPGGEVAGRVGVTVFPEATALAGKDSLAQRHVLAEPPARRAGLRRGEEPGSHRQGGPVPVGLVSELACQFAPGGVGDRLRQVVVLRHVLHRQVLDADGAVGLGDRARDPVGEVVASVGHPPMEAGQASPCLGPVQSGARAALRRDDQWRLSAGPLRRKRLGRSRDPHSEWIGAMGAAPGYGPKAAPELTALPNQLFLLHFDG